MDFLIHLIQGFDKLVKEMFNLALDLGTLIILIKICIIDVLKK